MIPRALASLIAAPWQGYHCDTVLSEDWRRRGCPERAAVVYVDRQGVRHGFCPGHYAAGIVLAARHGWGIEGVSEAEEAA